MVEAGQLFAARGGLDPEAELTDLDGLLVQVHAVEVVLQDLTVEVEEGALAAEFLQPGIGQFIDGMELVEGFDKSRAAAAGQAKDAEALEFLLPGFPEADEGLALRVVEGGQVVGVGIGQGLAGGPGGFGFVLAAEGLEAGLEDAAQGLLDEVAGDEGGGIDRAFLLAAVAGFPSRARASRLPFRTLWETKGQARRTALR